MAKDIITPFYDKDTGLLSTQCSFCKHFNQNEWTCKGFKNKIPDEIVENKFIHDKPYPGDNGFMYEIMTDEEILDNFIQTLYSPRYGIQKEKLTWIIPMILDFCQYFEIDEELGRKKGEERIEWLLAESAKIK